MEIRQKFDDLIDIMNDPFKAEELISKKHKLDLYGKINNKVSSIFIDEDNGLIKCTYNLDGFYKFNLKFIRTIDGYVDFKLSAPSLIYLIIIGAILGFRLSSTMGYMGIVVGVGVFAIISYIYKLYLQKTIWTRINKRWPIIRV